LIKEWSGWNCFSHLQVAHAFNTALSGSQYKPLALPEVDMIQDADQGIDDVQPDVDQAIDADMIQNDKGQNLSQAKKDQILIKVVQGYPGNTNAQKRAEVLFKSAIRRVGTGSSGKF